VTVQVGLPYRLALTPGRYGDIDVQLPAGETETQVSLTFETAGPGGLTEQKKRAGELMKATNRLLRWYRCLAGHAAAVEIAADQAGRFVFRDSQGQPWGESVGE
jgi:hypothetical protein